MNSWYPGHMLQARDALRSVVRYLTAVVEVVDARAPQLTRHAPLARWVGRTPVVLVLNKADLADPGITAAWLRWYRLQPSLLAAVALSAQTPGARQQLKATLVARLNPPYRLCVVGMPNVGKSTLLNRMVGGRRAAVGAKPGITRGPQWIRPEPGWEWLDLPGVVLPSKSRDWRLKALGISPLGGDEALSVAQALLEHWPKLLGEAQGQEPEAALAAWGRGRGFLGPGGMVDLQRTAVSFLGAFQRGALGRVSLERPPA